MIIMVRAINDYKIFFYDVYNLAFSFVDNEKKKKANLKDVYRKHTRIRSYF